MNYKLRTPNSKGATLIEILIGMLIVTIASIATLTYFAYAKGGIGTTGNRRAALERARQRLEQMMASNISAIAPPVNTLLPPNNQSVFWVSCGAIPCVWVPANPNETVLVDDLPNQPLEATIQWRDDPSANTPTTPDVLEFAVKVGFVPGWDPSDSTTDDDFNRVHVRTLRTP